MTLKLLTPQEKWQRLRDVGKACNCEAFIEVGSYLGETAHEMGKTFRQVVTIELDHKLWVHASAISKNGVMVLEGSGLDRLPKALDICSCHRSLLYLDGHYSGRGTACGDEPEPAVRELELLFRWEQEHEGAIGAIVVDDLRSFGTELGFPSKTELFMVAEMFGVCGFRVLVDSDQVLIVRDKADDGDDPE
jgi:hypothetical protein